MSVPVWSVVKFKIKEGCEDDFLAAHVFEDSHMKYMKSFNVIKIDDLENAGAIIPHRSGWIFWLAGVKLHQC